MCTCRVLWSCGGWLFSARCTNLSQIQTHTSFFKSEFSLSPCVTLTCTVLLCWSWDINSGSRSSAEEQVGHTETDMWHPDVWNTVDRPETLLVEILSVCVCVSAPSVHTHTVLHYTEIKHYKGPYWRKCQIYAIYVKHKGILYYIIIIFVHHLGI